MPSTVTDRLYGLTTSVAVKAPCVVASTGNLTLSSTQVIDGVAVTTGDRVLVKDQTDAVDNGIYEVRSGSWARTADCDGSRDLVVGTAVFVTTGSTLNAQRFFYFDSTSSTSNAITPSTDAMTIQVATFLSVSSAVTVTAFAETLLDDSSAHDMRETLGLSGALLTSSTSLQRGALVLSDSTGHVSLASSTGAIPYFTGGAGASMATLYTTSTTTFLTGGATALQFAPAGLNGAAQTDMESANSTTVATTPAVQHHHPGHPKFHVSFGMASTIFSDYGVASLTDNGAGDFTINFDTPFSSTNYTVTCGLGTTGVSTIAIGTQQATAVQVLIIAGGGGASESGVTRAYVAGFGDF